MRCFVYTEKSAEKITEKVFFSSKNFIFLNTYTPSYTLLASRQMTWPKMSFLNSLPLLPSSVSQEINPPLVMNLQNPVYISLIKAHKTL